LVAVAVVEAVAITMVAVVVVLVIKIILTSHLEIHIPLLLGLEAVVEPLAEKATLIQHL
jgi:hypothetical protein